MLSSHERCQVFGLMPQHRADLTCLSQTDLIELRKRNVRLCAQALPVMEMLYEQLSHAHSMVLLTDASGVILHAMGDPGFLERAQRIALAPGAIWSEAVKGTNAVGTALMTEAPTVVNGQDHYLRDFHFLTCSAAPIFDHKGALLGVVNVSGDRRSYHPHTLALATMAANMIETQWFKDMFRQSLSLHIHPSANGLGTLREGVLALDEAGRVLGVNRRAIEMIGQSAAQLRRCALPDLFGIELPSLLEHGQSYPDLPLQMALTKPAQASAQSRGGVGDLLVAAHVEAGGAAPARCLHGVLSFASRGKSGATALGQVAPVATPSGSDAAVGAAAAVERAASLTRSAAALEQAGQQLSPAGEALRPPVGLSETGTLRQTELQAIQAAVLNCKGNLALAARQLGIGRSTLYRKLKDLPSHTPQ
ncbi:GAF domain-containing protein [Paucibacter sp. B2R-40]|uniref:sigma-54-dependent Fis family transcriptional regulator n=1 Tax=Paucibacter sp. B2R-40 TaxID=2893554 RepID=UPI0021E3DD84|nr:helix-turn-helix domain-containing protein [Paucibacter sp. B2R-40]MCV2355552.1 GAF domain-containing protein [Paucibacter sp. B2R-40]